VDDVNFKPGPQAKVVLDSISTRGHRLTTFELTTWRFVLAEFNTHRVFSRNSASSRAIPFSKQVERVRNHPAVPVSFPAEQRGMQGGEELANRAYAESAWLAARDRAVDSAESLADLGVHKSVVNRLLEPFMWHTIIVTATDYDNFFALRSHPMAQPEIRVTSDQMRAAYNASTPTALGLGEWHMPYIDGADYDAAANLVAPGQTSIKGLNHGRISELLRQVSAARCARVSYLTHDGRRSLEADITLYKRLTGARPPHSSPLEHVATPSFADTVPGNFRGWYQLRHIVEQELEQ
jgi:thymidylate synthase ThyX